VTASPVRLVMIVDNKVSGDSRVQKMAESSAAEGFDVTVVGRSPDRDRHEWLLGSAKVILLPVSLDLLEYSASHPGRSIRWPLAYADKFADARGALERRSRQAAIADLRNRLDSASNSGSRPSLTSLGLPLRSAWEKVRGLWHGVRHVQFKSARSHRKSEHGTIDRLRAHTKAVIGGQSSWRILDPTLVDFERGMEPFIETLQPDLIHAHDFRMVGIAVRVAERMRARGHTCRVVYDAHEYMPGVHARNLSWKLGNEKHEAIYAKRADAVVTVSDRLAVMLKDRHGLRELPATVLNAPVANALSREHGRGIRSDAKIAAAAPLLVYIGSPAPQRGLMTIVEALPQLPGYHAALVLPPDTTLAQPLIARAHELDVEDRLHVLPYVEPAQVVNYIASATIGVIPLHHQLNHEISLITKYFDYAQARLPIVVSDVETMSRVTKQLGNGEVFEAESTQGFVDAVKRIMYDPDKYSQSYTDDLLQSWAWDAQFEKLIEVYRRLVARSPKRTAPPESAQ